MNSSRYTLLVLNLIICVFYCHTVSAAGEAQSPRESIWPIPKFYFSISANSFGQGSFQEVAGLESGSQSLTLSRGVMWDKNRATQYFASNGNVVPETITMHLRDESNKITQSWTLNQAYLVASSMYNSEKDDRLVFNTVEIAFSSISE